LVVISRIISIFRKIKLEASLGKRIGNFVEKTEKMRFFKSAKFVSFFIIKSILSNIEANEAHLQNPEAQTNPTVPYL
jgi:hypothetical protein